MNDSSVNRKERRRAAQRRVKTAAIAGAGAAAMTVGLAAAPGMLPVAGAAAPQQVIDWSPAYTAGTLASLLNFVSGLLPEQTLQLADIASYQTGPPAYVKAGPFALPSIPVLLPNGLDITLNLFLKNLPLQYGNINSGTAGLYNTIGNIPQPSCSGSYASNCRYAIMLSTNEASLYLAQALQAQIASVTTGATPAGFIPFQASPTSTEAKPTWTNEELAIIGNWMRPNGGILSRFPDISRAFGIDPVMPNAGKYISGDKKVVLNVGTIDAAWAYDPVADFPAVFNLTAIANSLSALLPLNLIGGIAQTVLTDSAGKPVDQIALALNLAGLLQLPTGVSLLPVLGMTDGKAYYATLVGNQLPLLAGQRLGGTIANFALSALGSPYLLGNPVADALEPALKILVNIAYPDVVTPSEGGTYNRTFDQSATQIPFGSVEPLTPEEKEAVPGDVWNALITGIQEQLAKPFWGILVPNPAKTAAASSAAVTPAAVKAAAATPVVESAPVAPVAAPPAPVEAPAPAVQVSAPAADPAPVSAPAAPAADPAPVSAPVAPKAEISLPADDPAPAPAPRAGGHRGKASVGSDNSDAPKASASTGHRGAA
jgi:hypothetical protein